MAKDNSLIIIGAGITGLAAGCYGQMNGYRTQIFELHDKPGGLCTSWARKGYTFDGCLEWLVGSGPGTSFNHIWRELGAVQGRTIVNHEEFTRVEIDGKQLILYTNADRLERHLHELAPADGPAIGEFCNLVRRFARASVAMGATGPAGPLAAARWFLAMLPYLGDMRKYAAISVQQYAARFSDPFLRRAIVAPFDLPDFSMLGVLFSLGWMHLQDAGYPIGGSLEFAEAIERRYCDLGGEIHYRSPVEKILVEPGRDGGAARAVGIRLRSGAEYRAGAVISAADGHATIFDMLDGRFVDDKVRGYYANLPIFQPIVQVSLGLARDLSAEPHSVIYALDRPFEVSGRPRDLLGVRHYCFDPTMAPAGKSVVVVYFESEYAYWRRLRDEDSERYEAEKQRVAEAVIDRLEARFPGLAAQVEAVDVATPLTTERYTGNWQGSIEGWSITTKTAPLLFGRGMAKTLPGLDHFYMAGQWVEPGGGVPTAAASGRRTIENLCKRDGKRFVAGEPK